MRASGLPYFVLRPTAMTNESEPGAFLLEASQGGWSGVEREGGTDVGQQGAACVLCAVTCFILCCHAGDRITGLISREELASVVVAALGTPAAAQKTAELRRQEAADAAGREMSDADTLRCAPHGLWTAGLQRG